MPVWGTLVVANRLADVPVVEPATEPRVLVGAEVLQLMFEISAAEPLVPPALHPTNPPTTTIVVWKTSEFSLAQVRVGCRAGVRPRGYVTHAYVEGKAAEDLSSRWGFPCVPGDIELRRGFDRVQAVVRSEGRIVLDCSLMDPEPISGGDILWVASMHLANIEGRLRLVQVDPEYAFQKADRGRPRLDEFDAEAFGEPRLEPVYPISASWARCDITLPRIRYVCDPDIPALQGTEKIA